MTRLADIEAHIGSMSELRNIVGAMRSLASMRLQEAQQALPGIRRYGETMASAIGAALLLAGEQGFPAQPGPDKPALVLCTAEHGFVGAFNERLLDAAERAAGMMFVLGTRGTLLAEGRGRKVAWQHPMASRPEGVPEAVRQLTAALYRAFAGGMVARVELIFALHRPGTAMEIARRVILPLDPAKFIGNREAPLHNLPSAVLLEKLAADYMFAMLMEGAVETLASENAARFTAMAAAHDHISEKLGQLRQDARQARQEDITAELLDLVTGSAALGNNHAP